MDELVIYILLLAIFLFVLFSYSIYANIQDVMTSKEICSNAGEKYVGGCGPLQACSLTVECLNESSHRIDLYSLR